MLITYRKNRLKQGQPREIPASDQQVAEGRVGELVVGQRAISLRCFSFLLEPHIFCFQRVSRIQMYGTNSNRQERGTPTSTAIKNKLGIKRSARFNRTAEAQAPGRGRRYHTFSPRKVYPVGKAAYRGVCSLAACEDWEVCPCASYQCTFSVFLLHRPRAQSHLDDRRPLVLTLTDERPANA